jgi:hypothetical protein
MSRIRFDCTVPFGLSPSFGEATATSGLDAMLIFFAMGTDVAQTVRFMFRLSGNNLRGSGPAVTLRESSEDVSRPRRQTNSRGGPRRWPQCSKTWSLSRHYPQVNANWRRSQAFCTIFKESDTATSGPPRGWPRSPHCGARAFPQLIKVGMKAKFRTK